MQNDHQFYPGKVVPPILCEVGGGFTYDGPLVPALGATLSSSGKHARPFRGVELQTSEVCPKNFIIFDRTDRKSRIMFHPALGQKFDSRSADVHAAFVRDKVRGRKDEYSEEKGSSSSLKEDTKDIDALMSFDEYEQEEDEEELSTARTSGSLGSSSPDSCSSYLSKPCKGRSSSPQKAPSECNSSSSSNSETKRHRMKKTVKALRGIVPGADQMNTAAVLDEAVRYLKSLKVEVKKLGLGNLDSN